MYSKSICISICISKCIQNLLYPITTGILAPTLIQFEEEIDRELAEESDGDSDNESDDNQTRPQIITNDLKSLHERVCMNTYIHIQSEHTSKRSVGHTVIGSTANVLLSENSFIV